MGVNRKFPVGMFNDHVVSRDASRTSGELLALVFHHSSKVGVGCFTRLAKIRIGLGLITHDHHHATGGCRERAHGGRRRVAEAMP